MKKMFLSVLLCLFMASIANAGGYDAKGKVSGGEKAEGSCQVKNTQVSFKMSEKRVSGGSIAFSGICDGKPVSAKLPATDGGEGPNGFTVVFSGMGKFDNSDFPMQLIIMGQKNETAMTGDMVLSFNGVIYNAGRFTGNR